LSQIRWTFRPLGTSVSILVRNLLNSLVRCRRCRLEITGPSAVLNAANRLVVPCRTWSWVRFSGMQGIIGNAG
jgi:hypothetical protein